MKLKSYYKRAILDAFGWNKDGGMWRNKRDNRLQFRDETMMSSEDRPFLNLVKRNDTVYGRKKLLEKLDWEWRPSLAGADTLYVKGKISITHEWMRDTSFLEFISVAITGWPRNISVGALAREEGSEEGSRGPQEGPVVH